MAEIRDGPSSTILVVEAQKPVPWSAPADVAFAAGQPPGLTPPGQPGFSVMMADGKRSLFLEKSIPGNQLRAMFTRAGGEKEAR